MKLVLVALKCDLRTDDEDDENDDPSQPRKDNDMIDYKEGLDVARRIQALRYLGNPHLSATAVAGFYADILYRMLRQAQSRCQRSLHRSGTGSTLR